METLAISAANLDTIEKNLNMVANELTGVMTNVRGVNAQVNKVESKVEDLNNEVKNLVKEIRETTIITNARQSIMYNNDQIEKKYGYYDNVRRTTESLMDAIENSKINRDSLITLNQELILNNPNYWLSNALASLSYWLLNDRQNTEKELHNALKKDKKKTSIFFCLINLKLGRTSTSLNWLNKYLSDQNPLKLDKDFITILDLVATGSFGDEAKNQVLKKINIWFQRLNSEKTIQDNQISIWRDYLKSHQDNDITIPILEKHITEVETIKENLRISSIYSNVLEDLQKITNKDLSPKSITDILSDLIYEYETKEQVYQKDNLKNQLIIECNGNREEAEKLYKKQESIYNEETDLLTLLSNIVIYKDSYKISDTTQKIALALLKDNIIDTINLHTSQINKTNITINIDKFTTTIVNNDKKNIKRDIELHLNNEFIEDDKALIISLIVINIIGIIGIFITLNNQILSTLLIIVLLIGNAFIFLKLNNKTKMRNLAKNKLRTTLSNTLESIEAQLTDCNNLALEDLEIEKQLMTFLKNLKTENYINSNHERNINIGE